MADPSDPGQAVGDTIWSVESALDAPPFGSLRAGSFVNDLLLRLANGGAVNPGPDMARLAEALILRTATSAAPAPPMRGQILVTLIDDSPRITDLVLPVAEELGARALVLPSRDELRRLVPSPARVVTDDQVGSDDRAVWSRMLRRAVPSWARSIRSLVRQGLLPRAAVPALAHLLVVQTRRAVRYQRAFELDPPDAVLVEYDRGAFAAPLVTAARALGIPTATMVHGSVHPHGYTPLVAEVALCWGDAQARQLEAAGAPPDRLVVTGCQRLGLHLWTRGKARADLGLDDRPLIMLATNNLLALDERLRLARVAFEAAATLGDTVQIGLRLHPRETPEDYGDLLASRADLQVLGGDRASTDQVLAACDLVLCGITAFADEAAILGVPAMIIDLAGAADITVGLGAEGPIATSRAELADLLDRWSRDLTWRRDLETRTRRRGKALCASTGRTAAARVADEILALADTPDQRRR